MALHISVIRPNPKDPTGTSGELAGNVTAHAADRFEAWSKDGRSLGDFPTLEKAQQAVMKAERWW